MAAASGRTVLLRQLGKELKKLREAAHKTAADAGQYAGIKGATVSKIENGKQTIRPANVRLLCQFYGLPETKIEELMVRAEETNKPSRLDSYTDTMPDWFARFVGLEEDASDIFEYESEVMPGLLQCPDYIRALRRAVDPAATEADLQRSVDFRQARQERLTTDKPPRLHFVLSEAVLHREVGGPQVHLAQLKHLIKLASLPHVTIQVLPFSAGAHPAMTAPFLMLRFEDAEDLDLVYLEHDLGATYLEKSPQVERYGAIFSQLADAALTREKTLKLLARLVKER